MCSASWILTQLNTTVGQLPLKFEESDWRLFPLHLLYFFCPLTAVEEHGDSVRQEGLFPRAYLWTLQFCQRWEGELCWGKAEHFFRCSSDSYSFNHIRTHHAQMKRFLAVCLPQWSVQFGSFCRFPAWAGLGKSRKVIYPEGKAAKGKWKSPHGTSWAALLWMEFFQYVCGKISHARCFRNYIAWCGQVCFVVMVYLKFQICNYSLYFLLYIHSLPSVSMVTWTALISIRNMFVSCHWKSVTSGRRFCCQTFFPARVLHGCSPIVHKEHFWTEKRQMCWGSLFPEGEDSFSFLQRSLKVAVLHFHLLFSRRP